jgi:hypothetical protein
MNRDLDLMREILLKIDSKIIDRTDGYGAPFGIGRFDTDFQFDGYTWDQVALNLDLLFDEQLIRGSNKLSPEDFLIVRLTSKGYDFLDSIRDPDIWQKTRDGAQKVGRMSVEFLWGIAKEFGKQKIKEKLGIDVG